MYNKVSSFKTLILVILLGIILTVGISAFVISKQPLKQHEVLIKAEQFQFTPSVINTDYNTNITFKILSMDITHGFTIKNFGINLEIGPLTLQTISIVVDKIGSFTISCSIPCGNFHPYMTGKLKVQPNIPLIISITALILTGINMAIWNLNNRKPEI